jgi:metal-responsive CopG/Arc/MetJ family transcriptional regulator
MGTLSVVLDAELERALDARSARESASRAELVRQALVQYLSPAPAAIGSALEQAGDLVGCFTGGPADLSANPRHLDDFGRI